MSSEGTASDISRAEADDLLQRLITDLIKVQAMFVGRGSVTASVRGFVTRPADDIVLVTEGTRPDDPSLCFGTKDVANFKYGDDRAFPSRTVLGTSRLTSALCFVYPDDAQICLFEIET